MTTDATVGLWLLMLASVAATLSVPPKSVLEKRLTEEARQFLDEEERRHLDHESIVGRQGAEIFDQLSIDDSKAGLSLIHKKMDKDGSGGVTEDELTEWMKKIHKRQVDSDANSYWTIYIGDSEALLLTWESFRNATYGLDSDLDDVNETNADLVAQRKSLRRYIRLWRKADQDGDGSLNKKESRDFFFPEESDTLDDVIVDETMEELDGNNDGYISQEEYLKDVRRISIGHLSSDHPDWLEAERKLFAEVKDNRPGRAEVKKWLLPAKSDRFTAEALRLIHQADVNQDGVLSHEEMTENYDKFVGSEALSYGTEPEGHEEF